jgi:hypothetical protein
MNPQTGINEDLEAQANEIIRKSLEGVTKYSEKADILTPWKEQDRKKHEVLTPTGLANPMQRQGTYGRVANLERASLNSREGVSGLLSHRPRPIQAWLLEQGHDVSPDSPPSSER